MCDLNDLLIGDNCDNNPGGLAGIAYVIPKNQLDTFASTYRDDATHFNEETGYAVDDLVIYQGAVYTCTTIHAAGAWNASNFTIIANGNVRVNGAHVPASGKGFVQVELNEDESLLTLEPLGKKFNRSGKINAQLFHPGSSEEAAEFAFQCKQAGGVVVIVERPDGKKLQIGTRNSLAEISPSWQTGTQESPDTRWLFEVSCYAQSLVYYEAAIPTV